MLQLFGDGLIKNPETGREASDDIKTREKILDFLEGRWNQGEISGEC